MIRKLLAAVLAVAFVAIVAAHLQAQSSLPEGDLSQQDGFKAMSAKTVSISSDTAVLIGTLPVGTHNVIVFSERALNYGGSTVTTSTAEPFVATTTVLTLTGFKTRAPTVYLRCRGTDGTATATLYPF